MTTLALGATPGAATLSFVQANGPGSSDTVRRAQAGDAEAFGALYAAHAGRIFALCLRLCGDRAEAEERLQDVWVRCWRQLPSYRSESGFGTWLWRLAVNEVLAVRRAASRRAKRVVFTDTPEALERPLEAPPGERLDLERAIGLLPNGARTVFVLHDIEGFQHAEIAAMTGIAVGTSKAQLFRARRLLREALER